LSLVIDASIYSGYFTDNSLIKRRKMQHFQSILFILGVLAILAVLIHGYLLNRKEKVSVTENVSDCGDVSSAQRDENEQDAVIGDVRIISTESGDQACSDFYLSMRESASEEIDFTPELSEQQLTDDEIGDSITLMNEPSEVDASGALMSCESTGSSEPVDTLAEQEKSAQEDYFVFNVAAKEGESVRGHELLQFFLTAGFRFGEMSIFHRHLHSDGTGPILFSIANMMTPGIFDPDNMEQFRSQGVSFFLTVPNHNINVKKAFDMMLVAVEQMAEEFDCVVLNEQRELMTEEQYRNYHERLLRYI
jgi:cell division protein ZipA